MGKRDFTVEQLEEWDVPYTNLAEGIELGGGRWYDDMWVVFEAPDDRLTYRFWHRVGKTEYQDICWADEFSDGIVAAERVELVTKVVEISSWEEV